MAAKKAVSTIGTVLSFGTESGSLTKLCPITSYPDMIGQPNNIEVTDLDDSQQSFIPGVKQIDTMSFEANYTAELWTSLAAKENTPGYFELAFGEDGADGTFEWQGQFVLGMPGHGNNEARTMTINVYPSTDVKKKA